MRVNPSTFIWRRTLTLTLISIPLISSSAFGWHKPATAPLVTELTQEERELAADVKPAWLSTSPFNRERGTNAEPPPEP
jgi:hypothetical protein